MKLTVKHNEDRLYPNLEAIEATPPQKRFIGRSYQMLNANPGVVRGIQQWGFVPSGPVTVPFRYEYVQALLDEDILPADEETAAYVQSLRNQP